MSQLASLLKPDEDFVAILTNWNAEHAKSFSFSDVAYPHRKPIFAFLLAKLSEERVKMAENDDSAKKVVLCLESIRILCREKMALDESFSDEKDVFLLFDLAYLRLQHFDEPIITSVRMEALKCLCNIIYNCATVQGTCKNAEMVEALIKNLEHEAASTPGDVQVALLSSKILFLITGFNPSMRGVAFQKGAISAVSKFVLPKLEKGKEIDGSLSDCIIESLKAIFNVASSADVADQASKPSFESLADLLRQILLVKSGRMEEICFQSVALMTLLPQSCFARLVRQNETGQDGSGATENDMTAIKRVLDHLDYVLSNEANSEHLVPMFVALARMCRANRLIRHYIRDQVLPPLHENDVRRLPQEGSTIRNRICRLLTSTNMDMKEHAADFLFILCKENVHRFIKYTGFGNAAGLLANRGLLGKAAGRHSNENGEAYSDESEKSTSDTEDYRNIRDEVNPVTGRVDPPVAKNPFEGMTDEQKEYEAMQLVNAIDRLQRRGHMQPLQMAGPSTLLSNDRREPVEHVLQLRDEFLKSQNLDKANEETSEDEDEN